MLRSFVSYLLAAVMLVSGTGMGLAAPAYAQERSSEPAPAAESGAPASAAEPSGAVSAAGSGASAPAAEPGDAVSAAGPGAQAIDAELGASVLAAELGAAVSAAELGASAIDNETIRLSLEHAAESAEALEGIMSDQEKADVARLFRSYTTRVSTIGVINTSMTFLKLSGMASDTALSAPADIHRQLDRISEKLNSLEQQVGRDADEMSGMKSAGDVSARGIKAAELLKDWQGFDRDYMEGKMDDLMQQYDTMLRNHVKDWIEYRNGSGRQSAAGGIDTTRVVLWYKGGNPLDPGAADTLMGTKMNDFQPEMSTPAAPDPFTMYGDDQDFNQRFDKVLILDDAFLPKTGEITWNINTYRSDLKAFFKGKLSAMRNESGAVREEFAEHVKQYRMDIEKWTQDDIDRYAEDMVNAVIYRINNAMVNESADLSTTLDKAFSDYCRHVAAQRQGIDAMLQALFLTNAFEYEAADAIRAFMDQMILRTGVYSMFAMDVMGMSEYIRNEEKIEAAGTMCGTLNSLERSKANSITGDPRYCYVTGSTLSYSEVTLTGSAAMKYYAMGRVRGFEAYSDPKFSAAYDCDDEISETPEYVGDTNALTIASMLKMDGQKMDHSYLNSRFSSTDRPEHAGIVTSIQGEQTLPLDSGCLMKTHRIIGDYFDGDPEVQLNKLPGKAGTGHLVTRMMLAGTTFDGSAPAAQQNRPLIGTAGYGENHGYWIVDEAALMGGPCSDPSFRDEFSREKIEDGNFSDTYRVVYSNSVTYNCLVQVRSHMLGTDPGPYPLRDFEKVSRELQEKSEAGRALEQEIVKAEKLANVKGWREESERSGFKDTIAEMKELLDSGSLTASELKALAERLAGASEYCESRLKKAQAMQVIVKSGNVKAGQLRKSSRIVKAVSVKNAQGKVSYKIVKVTGSKYKRYFSINKKNGKITVKKGLKKGSYSIRIKVRAAGGSKYLPAEKYAIVKVRVK